MPYLSKSRRRWTSAVATLLVELAIGNAAAMDVQSWPLPSEAAPASQPDFVATASGDLLLSWIEKDGDRGHRLRFSRYPRVNDTVSTAGGVLPQPTWQAARSIASGSDWFVNWADIPHLIELPDRSLWAHWLRRNPGGIANYGIALTRSADAGETWSAPIRVEPDGASNDYGFVSLWPRSRDQLGIAWLDSRQKPTSGDAHAHDHDMPGGPAMMLRAAVFDTRGRRRIEWPLDLSTCDCCPTAMAQTDRGPVLVYRGRAPGEIRDTRLLRFDGKAWSKAVTVHADGWKFAGCPVNGPAVTARGTAVWVAWYTEADGQPSLRLARSRDAGDRFDTPLRVAEGRAVLGRVALAMDAQRVWVAWLAEQGGDGGQELWLARFDAATGREQDRQRVALLTTRGRASGMPKLQLYGDSARLVWTDVIDGKSHLHGLQVR